ncbi:hypothetical protein RSOLAG1IB_12193 [Rhizoctonia solani AG-1 IB]|uniref:Uncharacterized protein n=1 Tax=Thanatephorus cucumeris (strain AG1-IB / isolate 7/3/14) TaxID=1108050 RepID=A0A0B7FRI9_THACB|nr:hypothetical protein RSOLAG1IB_12193 [Rhizoctonia solani AG-1 IB]
MAQNEIPLPLGDLDRVVPLTNLLELYITLDGSTDDDPDDELSNTLVELIRGAANIEYLSLVFEEDDDHGAAPWGSVELFMELDPHCFPNLRMLGIKSLYLVPIDNYSGPKFRQLIRNSNKLQKIILSTDGYDSSPRFIDPPLLIITYTDTEEMMPSIRHFGGPGLLVRELLKSKLAKQIQLLELREPGPSELGGLHDLLPEFDNSTMVELPNLKGLGYLKSYEEDNGWEAITSLLSKLSTRLLALQELILAQFDWPEPSQLVSCLSTLLSNVTHQAYFHMSSF